MMEPCISDKWYGKVTAQIGHEKVAQESSPCLETGHCTKINGEARAMNIYSVMSSPRSDRLGSSMNRILIGTLTFSTYNW